MNTQMVYCRAYGNWTGLVLLAFVTFGAVIATVQPGNSEAGPRTDRSRPGPWNSDVLAYRVAPDGETEKLATFERAGVPTAARLQDGRLAVAHQHFPEDNDADFDKVAVRFSADEGRSWTAPQVIRVTGVPAGMRFPFDPTLVSLPDGRVRLYFTSVKGRTFQDDWPAIYSAISSNAMDYVIEPGVRFEVEGRMIIDCAVVLHRGVFHLFVPNNGDSPPQGPRPAPARRPRDGAGYHATSADGLNFSRQPDVQIEGRRRWLGNAQSDGNLIRFFGTGDSGPGRPGGVWTATSADGQTWKLDATFSPVSGADPGAVKLKDGSWLIVVTGPPRGGTSVARRGQYQAVPKLSFVVPDTGQTNCYNSREKIPSPKVGEPFCGQDAQISGPQMAYRDNGDGTVTDLNTGLTWVQARGAKMTWDEAVAGAAKCRMGGHSDWRMPTIKELYSLINFNGSFDFRAGAAGSRPYLDTKFFRFDYGDESKGEREIDCQDWSATEYIGTTMNGNPTVFGVNFADGRIKGYPKFTRGPQGQRAFKLYVRYVRGNPAYGKNDFHDNGDGSVTDRATGLIWSRADSGGGMNWEAALAWVQNKNAEKYLGHADWRLPSTKELQSIVDYTRSPAINPVFQMTKLSDGEFPFFWSSTTHLDGPADRQGATAVYVCFGRGLGWMQFPPGRGEYRLLDVHGAGAQRSDPKSGDPAAYPHGRGPQGDVIRINNFVRLVRGGI